MDKKYGVYICTGCGIGDALDIEALSGVAGEEGLPVQTHPFLCSQAGVDIIKKDTEEKSINTMVIGACSRRVNFDTFRFVGSIVERVNLREGVVWSHPRDQFPALTAEEKEDEANFDRVQMMAEDYLRMGMARVKKVDLPEAYQLETFSRKILVIGGGITGISAAIDAAKAGYEVTIVEKEDQLGGQANNWRKQLPLSYPYDTTLAPTIGDQIKELDNYANISVRTNTVVARLAGEPGNFTVTLKKPGEKIEFDVPYPLPDEMKVDEKGKELNAEQQHEKYLEYNEGRKDILKFDPNGEKFGAVVLAAGYKPYEPKDGEFAHLGFGELPDVVTNATFEAMAKTGHITRPSDGKRVKSIAFIQCGGSRDKAHHSYCSSICCLTSLKQALYLREGDDDAKAYIFYEFIRTPGQYEDFYRRAQEDPGIFFTKGEVLSVKETTGGDLVVDLEHFLHGGLVGPAPDPASGHRGCVQRQRSPGDQAGPRAGGR